MPAIRNHALATKPRRMSLISLRRDESGVAAIEFAMVAPILLTLFLGAVEFSQALTLDRRVTTVASSIADLVAQAEQVSTSELDDIMNIGRTIMETALVSQYNDSDLDITVISVVSDADGNIEVDWSYDRSGSQPYANGSSYPNLPANLLGPSASVVVTEVSYDFDPPVGKYLTDGIKLEERAFLRPRRGLNVELN